MNQEIDITGVVLHTPRLTLRPWREEDLEDFYAYARVEGVGQMAGWLPHKDRDESRTILELFIREKKTFALEYRGRVVGSLGVERYEEADFPELAPYKGREIGYVLAKDCWGQGLMPEAVAAVVEYLFGQAGLDFILVGHMDFNTRSARVIEKSGFRYCKTTQYETRYNTTENSLMYIRWNPAREKISE